MLRTTARVWRAHAVQLWVLAAIVLAPLAAAVRAGLEHILTEAGYARTAGLGARLATGIEAMIAQHHLLNDVADLIDKGVLRTTLDQTFGTINAANLKRAHALLESGKSRGKIVLEGW